MKLIKEVVSKKRATYYLHNHTNIFSLPIYHSCIIDATKPLNRKWGRSYNDTYIFLDKIFENVISVNNKIVYDFTCNIGTISFLILKYNPRLVYGVDNDYICLLLANYIKENSFSYNSIYFIEGDITKESFIFNQKDSIGLLINLPFGKIKNMYVQVTEFLNNNKTDYLITDNIYDNELGPLFLNYYRSKKNCGYYSIYSNEDL